MARPKPIRVPERVKLQSKPVIRLLTKLHARDPK
jgi:hypothetical protein